MNELIFDPHVQYRRVMVNNWCTSPAALLAIIILTTGSLIFGLLWFWNISMPFSVAGAFMTITSLDALFLLMFTYGVTYLPTRPTLSTISELLAHSSKQRNLAQAAEYSLIETVGPHARHFTPQELASAVEAIFSHPATEELLRRIQFPLAETKQALAAHVLPHLTWPQFAQLLLQTALKVDHDTIGVTDAAGALLLHPRLHAYIRQRNLQESEIEFVIWWQNAERDGARFKSRWWDERNLLSFTGIGLSWVAGYTPFIDLFSRFPAGRIWDTAFGREELVEQLTNVLARQEQGNVLLVGEPGVGRLGIVKEFVRRTQQHQSHPQLNGQRLVYLHLNELIAQGTSGAGQLNVLTHAFRELERAGNIVAVFDGLSSVLGAEVEGKASLAEALTQVFSSQEVKTIAIMSYDDYHSRVKRNDELLHYFEVVHVPPLSADSTLRLLAITSRHWKKRTGIYLPYQTLREIVKNTEHILPYVPFPEKAFDVLEEAVVIAEGRREASISPEDIQSLVSQKVGVNVGSIQAGEQRHLLELADRIHKRVVNQKMAVAAVARAMIRSRAGVRTMNRPIGTFLFLGPTGVGKTETAKALAEAYFGSESRLQRLDMSEFQGEEGVERLIGSAKHSQGRLTDLVADNPFSVLLLDEFEKADRLVQQLFLPVFDEGFITDAHGRRYSFAHTIIIATSNAGAEFIRQAVDETGNTPTDFDMQLRDTILQDGTFRPEVLNRFDGVITFVPLSPEHIRQVAHLMLQKLNRRLDAEHGFTVVITDELVEFLVGIGFDADFGARPMARAIQNTVEYAVAEEVVRGTVQPGQALQLNVTKLRALQATSVAR